MKIKFLCLALCFLPIIALSDPKVIINKSSQTYVVIDDGKVIKKGRVSTGKRGYPTPVGYFKIHTKYKSIMSQKYKVPMRNAMFFRGTKYAMHYGVIPGYPASHGCVRLSLADSNYLFSKLSVGTAVIIK